MDRILRQHINRYLLCSLLSLLIGCSSFSPDGGFHAVTNAAHQHLKKDVIWAKSAAETETIAQRVTELLKQPLSVESAVQIALFNNRGLQASFAELSIAEADLVQAGKLPNPTFSMLRASKSGVDGRDYKIEQGFLFNLFALVTMPQQRALEQRRFTQTQRTVSLAMLKLATETRAAYYSAIAAQESVRYAQQVCQAAEASAELAKRMLQAGNFNKLQHAHEQTFYAEAKLGLKRTEQQLVSAREHLTRLLGLDESSNTFALPEHLPDLPQTQMGLSNIEQIAITQRFDVQAIRMEVEALAKNLGLSKTTRFINVLEFGPARVLEGPADSGYKKGYELSFELPLFDWGEAKVVKAEALYMQALHRAAAVAIHARSEIRDAYSQYRVSYEMARHYRDEILPIKKRISAENQLRYNAMLISVFDLLEDARSQIASVNSYIEVLRDFWIAEAKLQMVLLGKLD